MKHDSRVIIKDPLYKVIFVDKGHKKFLDSLQFQRLRYIKQTSFVDFVYPNANHTRFNHSLGVYHLMKKVISNNLMVIPVEDRETLLLAALMHDIGHGPFSHFWEKLFPHFNHEEATREMLKEMGLAKVADLLAGKSRWYPLISSTIDMDKLDYMARDSYFAGVSYGVTETDFIIDHLFVKDDKLVIQKSAISSVEDLITQRVNLFKVLYYHKFAIEYDFLFSRIFKRVKFLYEKGVDVSLNPHLKAFFEKKDSIDDLMALNDYILVAHVFRWAEHEDKILKELCSMFIGREKFEVYNLDYEKIDTKKLKKKVAEKYDLDYFYDEVEKSIEIIQTPLYVEINDKLMRLEDVSSLIKFYKKQNWKVRFVIAPREIRD